MSRRDWFFRGQSACDRSLTYEVTPDHWSCKALDRRTVSANSQRLAVTFAENASLSASRQRCLRVDAASESGGRETNLLGGLRRSPTDSVVPVQASQFDAS